MLKRLSISPLLILVCIFLTVPAAVQAASVKERMASRLPAINSLKDSGAVGENNKGFLEFRSGNKPQQNVVSAENGDRRKVYAAIGKKQGASPALVGQRRAQMIAQKGKKGHWFQSPDGKWYKK